MIKYLLLLAALTGMTFAEVAKIEFKEGDRIVFVGNTFAERMVRYGYFESVMYRLFPTHKLTFRNLGWSGDEIWAGNGTADGNAWSNDPLTTQIRPLHFGTQKEHLTEQKADVIFACYGMNESFAGTEMLGKFEHDLSAWVDAQLKENYSGKGAPRIVLVSPICHEKLKGQPDPTEHNKSLEAYTATMKNVAEAKGVAFADVFNLTQAFYIRSDSGGRFTINGIHLTNFGYKTVGAKLAIALSGIKPPEGVPEDRIGEIENTIEKLSSPHRELDKLDKAVNEKNLWFFHRYHALNGEYIYGRRKEPFGVVSFPPEMNKLDQIIEAADQKIWDAAKPESKPKP